MFLQAPGRAGEPARLRAMVLTVMTGRSGGNIQALVNPDPVAARSGMRALVGSAVSGRGGGSSRPVFPGSGPATST